MIITYFSYIRTIHSGKASRINGLQNKRLGDYQSKIESLQGEKTCSEVFEEILSRKNERKIMMLMKYSTLLANNVRSNFLQMNDTETKHENNAIMTTQLR